MAGIDLKHCLLSHKMVNWKKPSKWVQDGDSDINQIIRCSLHHLPSKCCTNTWSCVTWRHDLETLLFRERLWSQWNSTIPSFPVGGLSRLLWASYCKSQEIWCIFNAFFQECQVKGYLGIFSGNSFFNRKYSFHQTELFSWSSFFLWSSTTGLWTKCFPRSGDTSVLFQFSEFTQNVLSASIQS